MSDTWQSMPESFTEEYNHRYDTHPMAMPSSGGTWSHRANYSAKARATMLAFNHFLQVMKYRRDTCDFYMMQFSGRDQQGVGRNKHRGPLHYKITHEFVDLFTAMPLNYETYDPDGAGTAIYDAIMHAIADVEAKIDSLPVDERPTQVTMLIQTDGDDNSSILAPNAVIQKTDELRQKRWNFIFLGTTGGDRMGERLGFKRGHDLLSYQNNDAAEAFEKAAESVLESLITGTIGGI